MQMPSSRGPPFDENENEKDFEHNQGLITDRMGVATSLPPKYDRGGLLRENRVCSPCQEARQKFQLVSFRRDTSCRHTPA